MASLASVTSLKASPMMQPPGSSYTDRAIYALEQNLLFAQAPKYTGHELMVPHPGDFHTLEWMHNAKALVHNEHGIELISNVCRDRQALMLKGKGHAQHIVCPLHRWTYNLQGELLGSSAFCGNSLPAFE